MTLFQRIKEGLFRRLCEVDDTADLEPNRAEDPLPHGLERHPDLMALIDDRMERLYYALWCRTLELNLRAHGYTRVTH